MCARVSFLNDAKLALERVVCTGGEWIARVKTLLLAFSIATIFADDFFKNNLNLFLFYSQT